MVEPTAKAHLSAGEFGEELVKRSTVPVAALVMVG
jgi:hypothetical protein